MDTEMKVRHDAVPYNIDFNGVGPPAVLKVTGHSEVGPVEIPFRTRALRYMLGGTHVYTQERK